MNPITDTFTFRCLVLPFSFLPSTFIVQPHPPNQKLSSPPPIHQPTKYLKSSHDPATMYQYRALKYHRHSITQYSQTSISTPRHALLTPAVRVSLTRFALAKRDNAQSWSRRDETNQQNKGKEKDRDRKVGRRSLTIIARARLRGRRGKCGRVRVHL